LNRYEMPNRQTGRQSAYWPLIVWRMETGGAEAVRSAAGDPSAYASGVAYERISIDPNRMSGLPCIRDTRVTVSAVLGQLAAGLNIPELLADFPFLEWADVLAALEFAAAAVQERELPLAHSAQPPCVFLSAPTCHRRPASATGTLTRDATPPSRS
jgi:uncharacterized protein (DUF433 family)